MPSGSIPRVAASQEIVPFLVQETSWIHSSLLRVTSDLDEELFHARPGPKAPSIAFHLWHMARWADAFQAAAPNFASELARIGPRNEIWKERSLAAEWSIDVALGWKGAGTGLDDDASASLRLPGKAVVAVYAREAFDAAEGVLGAIRDDELLIETTNFFDDDPWPLLQHFTWHFGHGARHLGMMEALKGVLGLRGTATI
jgi:uncharacterized damage-inducible protein DinB